MGSANDPWLPEMSKSTRVDPQIKWNFLSQDRPSRLAISRQKFA
jgi:hypothetical protein